MQHRRRKAQGTDSLQDMIVASLGAFRPDRLTHPPVIFATVVAGLMTGLIGLGDLVTHGPKPFAVLEMSATFWLVAFIATFIEVLINGTGRH